MMLLSKRIDRQSWASLLPRFLLCLLLANVSASMPAMSKCPRHIDCAREGRLFCQTGESHCGPCLTPLEEDEEGRCIPRKWHHHNVKAVSFPNVEAEIDYLHSVITKQKGPEVQQPEQTDLSLQPAPIIQTEPPQHRGLEPPLLLDVAPTNSTSHHPTPPTSKPAKRVVVKGGPNAIPVPSKDSVLVLMISIFILVGTVAMVLAAVCWVRLQRDSRLAQKADYPAFNGKVSAPTNGTADSLGDKTLAHNAQMYHYQHQKQQMLSMGKPKADPKVPESEATSDEEEVGGGFTVYECPGLAPTTRPSCPTTGFSVLTWRGTHATRPSQTVPRRASTTHER